MHMRRCTEEDTMTTIGYCRTSTIEQIAGLEAQERDLKAAGCERLVSEQISSVAERAGLDRCLASLQPGDVLMVTKPDRLARSTSHLLSIVEDLNARSIGLIVLSMGGERVDTRNPTSKLILTILAGVAAWEREIMLERQREGLNKARAAGKRIGGSEKKIDRAKVMKLRQAMSPTEIATFLGIARASVYRILDESKEPAAA
jgi:DNA invertase Pin-like site-specific DNA recombinase